MINTVHVSDIGRVRSVNEDSVWTGVTRHGYTLAIIADGMGGHLAGDTASRLALETIRGELEELAPDLTGEELKDALLNAVIKANATVFEQAGSDERYHNMGTTVVSVLMGEQSGCIGHIGDSRAYIIKDGIAKQLTEDHTLVNELFKNGQISQEELGTHPRRNVLIRALGTDQEIQVDLLPIELGPGEVLLLCSDGLSNFVSAEHLGKVAGLQEISLEERADRLLQLALLAGGGDNISVAMLEHQEEAAVPESKEWDR
ncbi:Stp1/IreP family PP2C-type Ser/Thr phosphatase [Paenibacillus sp. HN-1]|uniref:Stp1/IreP family PP2C-type Ser/Thr phosphatase n=1 Tax=Paenibacillus TaxID=44249 RepID=UPI001CA7FB66|nr:MULTISPECIES: Stp1/IreP family PP2C-type Ser/Thr phosphatase [Paenibacillus]MBY9082280.1 Stp1/IreP family PP2C-type Ser/Thr phosphatase [Paenibacillus sp. CGMCC 1.18879]MBY9086356.1 Stp1/IreP family PP2C-type Ser/Thr phosphatase [Paenibacillus sinensis]